VAGSVLVVEHRHVVLVRGINVGANRKVPMAQLRELCAAAGCSGVRTYIQSGNVVLDSPMTAPEVADVVAGGIEERCGFRPAVMVRDPADLARLLESQPFGPDAANAVHVGFLATEPAAEAAAAAADVDIAPEEVRLVGRELLLHLPNGMGRSRFGKVPFERLLGVDMTVRNLRTVAALVQLAASEPS
jgi:uncharacterized protein (DUF1697 family)